MYTSIAKGCPPEKKNFARIAAAVSSSEQLSGEYSFYLDTESWTDIQQPVFVHQQDKIVGIHLHMVGSKSIHSTGTLL